MLVMGLASVIIGMSIFGKLPFFKGTTVVFLGSILYKACLSIALNLNFNPNYLKLLMAIIFLIALVGNDMAKKGGKAYAKARRD
jgi:putative ABC transport system permease protein